MVCILSDRIKTKKLIYICDSFLVIGKEREKYFKKSGHAFSATNPYGVRKQDDNRQFMRF